jgi:superfamily I DNA and RNA helicase
VSKWPHEVVEKLTITNFHTIGQRLLSKDFTVTTKNGFDRGATDEKIKNNLARELKRRHFDAFDVAMIDEAQDLTNDNIFTILTLLKPQRKVGIFSDSKQTLFTRNWELDSEMFDGGILEQRLNRNYRNTDKIFESFKKYSQESTIPMIRSCSDYVTKEVSVITRDMICDVITEKLSKGTRLSDIALISTSEDVVAEFKKKNVVNSIGVKVYFKDNLDKWYKGETILSTTIQSFKGLEAKIVFFFSTENCSDELKYVGESRARFELYLVE